MIYITGDTHKYLDIGKLNTKNFPKQKDMTRSDYIIICGDFGCVWDNSPDDMHWRDWHNEKNYTTLFIDGNHENFDLLEKYEVVEWNGGKVQFIKDNVIHLMRGQVYEIDGKKVFTMGGGDSIDKISRIRGRSWWEQEQPSHEEYLEAMDNLNRHNWGVDYVITHTTSMKNMKEMCYIKEDTPLNDFFGILQEKLTYRHWYFGHFHEDIRIDKRHTAVFDKVLRIGE